MGVCGADVPPSAKSAWRRAQGRDAVLSILLGAIAIPAQSNSCSGPGLHSLRLLDAHTVEVQGDGGTARTRDGGKTWQTVAGPSPDTKDAFDHREFGGPAGHRLQNVAAASNVVIEQRTGQSAWRMRWEGLLLEVRRSTAFVYVGALSRPNWSDKGWLLASGDVDEHAIGDGVDDLQDTGPNLKVEFRPGSVRVCTPNSWRDAPCGPALKGAPDSRPFLLTGFAVAPSRLEDGQARPRDVYLATEGTILHWQSDSFRWSQIMAPSDWVRCSGSVPRP